MMIRFNRTRSQVDRERGKKVGGKSDAKNQHNTEARKGEREEKKKTEMERETVRQQGLN